jgi:hypothetical protein
MTNFSFLSKHKLEGTVRHYRSLAGPLNWMPRKHEIEALPSGAIRSLIMGNARSMDIYIYINN